MQRHSRQNDQSKEDVLTWIRNFQEHNDEHSQNNLVLHFKPLVETLARKYAKGKDFYDDLFQVGMLGLLGAIRRYNESFGKSFEAFAVPTIIGEIKRYLRDKTWSVHVPRRIKELGPKIKSTVEMLEKELSRSPTVLEIAEKLQVSEEEVLEAMEIGKSYRALSVDHTIDADSDGGTVTLLDMVGTEEEGFEKVDQRLVVEKVMHVLNERERQIIQYTFIDHMSQKECGIKLGISQMHVSRLQRRAVRKLKEAANLDISNPECML
ncbi:RNA polymerase sigma factor SigB [Caldibacillus lycopersici]|uniref:RNA polymerase sigma factor SigB n=1 Tax=Perspicuibacillus lycopersici TaxID=1325689 RepID=A0AAE3IV25_9BACI|nr:RNA polymerase sigma factor SigB [Perspicuibacillus lycopersici]MCU9615170.1 RNA polymerase sigma factor SigB [Perspicuibacillus lycopersici]